MKLTAAYFLHKADATEQAAAEDYDFFVAPTEELAKSAALEDARREVERLKEAQTK